MAVAGVEQVVDQHRGAAADVDDLGIQADATLPDQAQR